MNNGIIFNNKFLGKYTVAIINLGCKVNKYESDSMKKILYSAGFMIVEPDDIADFYIVNTCSVTNIAEKKSRQLLRRAKRKNPQAVIVAAGCYVNASADKLKNEDFIDILIGNNCKKNIAEVLNDYIIENHILYEGTNDKSLGNNIDNNIENDIENSIEKTSDYRKKEKYVDINKTDVYEEMGRLDAAYMDHRRAYVKIQDGCNQFCSYCIIPYTRGRIRSRKPEHIINEITGLADQGVKEIVLTGIHISSYGKDFTEDHKREENREEIMNLGDLICKVAEIDGVKRIRLGSLEPRIITKEFLDKVITTDKLCPHFHLSLQSACNATLKRMNRKYSVEEFIDKCELIRNYYDRPAITTDVIVGFPGETDEDFKETYENLKKINLYEMHVFKYSLRDGTAASKMPDQVSEDKKNERSNLLLELTAKQKKEYEDSLKGLVDEVLIEEMLPDSKYLTGHTKRYVRVKLSGDKESVNEILTYTHI